MGKWQVDRLAGQLRSIGVEPGDRLFVHTGLRATGLARDEVSDLLSAYLDVVGSQGAVFYPTHTYSFRGGRDGAPFHPDLPCDKSLGVWPEIARKTPGAVRSLQPTHSAGGIGAYVAEILEGHENFQPVGVGSPLDKLAEMGGKVLLVGCGFESCTLIHLAEVCAETPYLRIPYVGSDGAALVRTAEGVVEVPLELVPGCSSGFPKMEPGLRARGVIRDGHLAEAPAMLCDMRALLDAATALLREDPLGYLCDKGCPTCAVRRQACGG